MVSAKHRVGVAELLISVTLRAAAVCDHFPLSPRGHAHLCSDPTMVHLSSMVHTHPILKATAEGTEATALPNTATHLGTTNFLLSLQKVIRAAAPPLGRLCREEAREAKRGRGRVTASPPGTSCCWRDQGMMEWGLHSFVRVAYDLSPLLLNKRLFCLLAIFIPYLTKIV